MTQFVSVEKAAELIGDRCALGVGGFCGFAAPDSILKGIRKRYLETGHPSALSIITPAAAGDGTEDGWGLAALREEGLVDSIYSSVLTLPRSIQRLVSENKIAAYIMPLGVFGHLFRSMAGHEPGLITHVGLNTFCDPREEGCKINQKAKSSDKKLVEVIELNGKEWLFYHNLPMDVCIMRATYADELGNISIEKEAVHAETLEMALAVHNNGGKVIFQVEKIVPAGSLDPRKVVVHKSSVDYVCVSNEGDHLQNYGFPEFRGELCGEGKSDKEILPIMPLNIRKIIARRAAMEIKEGNLVNIGLGISDGVSMVAHEEGVSVQMSIETGLMGGTPLVGVGLGASADPEAMYTMPETFDLYNGGGLDQSFLSGAEIDKDGNVNVSRFAGRIIGPGGFINIAQNTHKICFLGTFMAGKTEIECKDGELHILKDGSTCKYVDKVEQITFSAKYAREIKQEILYITERAVFRLTDGGVELIEIAPGIDLQEDVLSKMAFRPLISKDLRRMDSKIFKDELMGLNPNKKGE